MTERLKIGLNVPSRMSGGGRVFYQNLIDALGAPGFPADLVLFVSGPKDNLGAIPSKVRVVELGYSKNRVLDRLLQPWRLKRAFSAAYCDAVIFAGTTMSRVGATTHVFWPLTVAPLEPLAVSLLARTRSERARWLLLKFGISRAASKADATVFSSRYAADLYRTQFRFVRNTPSAVIWPAVSISGGVEREPVGGVTQPISVLFVSHVYPYKRLVELINAFADCYEQTGVDMVLEIAGSIPDPIYGRSVRKAIADTGCGERVRMRGNLDQGALRALYLNADVFVFPSASENAGSYALIDAFRYGIPVISSKDSSMPEICGPAAVYVNVESREAFTAALSRFVTDEKFRSQYANLAAVRIGDFPTWGEIAEELYYFLRSRTELAG